jgi:hypothetical protein
MRIRLLGEVTCSTKPHLHHFQACSAYQNHRWYILYLDAHKVYSFFKKMVAGWGLARQIGRNHSVAQWTSVGATGRAMRGSTTAGAHVLSSETARQDGAQAWISSCLRCTVPPNRIDGRDSAKVCACRAKILSPTPRKISMASGKRLKTRGS